MCVPLGFDFYSATMDIFRTLQKTFNRCLPDDNVSKFYSVFSNDSSVFGKFSFFSGLLMKKKMGPKKWVTYINLSHALD